MINTPTTLILGAGASVDYGYPLGEGLMAEIVQLGSAEGFTKYFYVGAWVTAVNEVINRLRTGAFRSIDQFLGSYQISDLTKEAGKLAISYVLNKKYFAPRMRPVQCDPDTPSWYQLLSFALFEGVEKHTDLAETQLRIVTFNYDLSLELFLIMQIKAHWPELTELEVRKTLGYVQIVHVYGELGDPIDYFNRFSGGVAELTEDTIKASAKRIHVIPENRPQTTAEFRRAQAMVGTSERIAFLGFGFDFDNLQRLNLAPILKESVNSQGHYVASAYKMRYAEVANVHQQFLSKFYFEIRDQTVYDCIRDFGILNPSLPVDFNLGSFKTALGTLRWFPPVYRP